MRGNPKGTVETMNRKTRRARDVELRYIPSNIAARVRELEAIVPGVRAVQKGPHWVMVWDRKLTFCEKTLLRNYSERLLTNGQPQPSDAHAFAKLNDDLSRRQVSHRTTGRTTQ